MLRCRPRLRFSLSTLLVLVTVAAIASGWVGYQWRVVQERKTVRAWMNERASQNPAVPKYGETLAMVFESTEDLSWMRRVLGDIAEIRFDRFPTTPEEQNRYMSAFPNAAVVEWTKELEKEFNSIQQAYPLGD